MQTLIIIRVGFCREWPRLGNSRGFSQCVQLSQVSSFIVL